MLGSLASHAVQPSRTLKGFSGLSTSRTSSSSSLGQPSARISKVQRRVVLSRVVDRDRSSTETTEPRNWFEETRNAAAQTKRPKSNNVDRSDLYTDNWDGDVYKGSGVNILTVLIGFTIGVPVIGLIFAYFTFGEYWG